ncbi:MAG: cyanophycin synthetase [Acidimicrobiia bacterium]|nr:cyanophycin synthetase [Acidimicrobiia bacterium]
MSHIPADRRTVTFAPKGVSGYRVREESLVTDAGTELRGVDELPRTLPHDLANALAASATALEGGATVPGVHAVLTSFTGLPHRVEVVAEADGVTWVDDSKATAPHATLSALSSFDSVVLIAGGQNKGLDLGTLSAGADRLRAVVAIGAAADEVARVFEGVVPVGTADSMADAVRRARSSARPGDVVLLSPAVRVVRLVRLLRRARGRLPRPGPRSGHRRDRAGEHVHEVTGRQSRDGSEPRRAGGRQAASLTTP